MDKIGLILLWEMDYINESNLKNHHHGEMELPLGGEQSHCRTDHAISYLSDVGAAHAFLSKKHELIKKEILKIYKLSTY